MPHFPKPFFRKSRRLWYVQIDGRQHNLGPDRDAAFQAYHGLMAAPPEPRREEKPPDGLYLVPLIRHFMDDLRAEKAPDTVEWYRHRLQMFVDYLGGHELDGITVGELKRGHVRRWINAYPHLSAGSRRNLCRAIQRVLNWAVECDLIPHSPLARLRKPKAGKRERVISDAEWRGLLESVSDADFRDLLFVSWEAGCRPHESLIVEARHVDLTNSRWVFPQSESKTDAPPVVYLTEPAVEITKRRMLRFPQGPLFRNSKGGLGRPTR